VFSLSDQLIGRVGFVATMPSKSASIFINNTQLSDTGTYQCLVNNLPDRGGRNIGVIGLTVLGKDASVTTTRRYVSFTSSAETEKKIRRDLMLSFEELQRSSDIQYF